MTIDDNGRGPAQPEGEDGHVGTAAAGALPHRRPRQSRARRTPRRGRRRPAARRRTGPAARARRRTARLSGGRPGQLPSFPKRPLLAWVDREGGRRGPDTPGHGQAVTAGGRGGGPAARARARGAGHAGQTGSPRAPSRRPSACRSRVPPVRPGEVRGHHGLLPADHGAGRRRGRPGLPDPDLGLQRLVPRADVPRDQRAGSRSCDRSTSCPRPTRRWATPRGPRSTFTGRRHSPSTTATPATSPTRVSTRTTATRTPRSRAPSGTTTTGSTTRAERLHGAGRACTRCTTRSSSRLPIPQAYYDVPLIVTDAMFDSPGPAALRRRRRVRPLRRRDPRERPALAGDEGRAAQVPLPHPQRLGLAVLPLVARHGTR